MWPVTAASRIMHADSRLAVPCWSRHAHDCNGHMLLAGLFTLVSRSDADADASTQPQVKLGIECVPKAAGCAFCRMVCEAAFAAPD